MVGISKDVAVYVLRHSLLHFVGGLLQDLIPLTSLFPLILYTLLLTSLHVLGALRLRGLTSSRVICGPVRGPIYVEACKDCVVVAAGRQVHFALLSLLLSSLLMWVPAFAILGTPYCLYEICGCLGLLSSPVWEIVILLSSYGAVPLPSPPLRDFPRINSPAYRFSRAFHFRLTDIRAFTHSCGYTTVSALTFMCS